MARAIIIGGSIGGLLAAKALSPHVDAVTIIDRDVPPDTPTPRKGVGQGTQAHALLDSGRRAIEALLPGIFDDLTAAGATRVDFGEGVRWYHAGTYKLQGPVGVEATVQSRPFLEHHIRQRVAADLRVTIRHGVRCVGLTRHGGHISGVKVQEADGTQEHLPADIVILATGRGTQPEKWLGPIGVAPPPREAIPIGIGYASRVYERLPDVSVNQPALMSYATRSRSGRQAFAFRNEKGQVLVTTMGYHGDHAPADAEGFQQWLEGLESPDIARNTALGTAVSKVVLFRTPEQVRLHWHETNLPEGLAILGDAACALDPVFGQGMSTAALQAHGLARLLAQGPFRTARVQKMVFAKSRRAWFITSVEAARFPQSRPHVGLPGVGVVHWFLDRVFKACGYDRKVYAAFVQVLFLNKGASHLFRPDLLWRILRPARQAPAPRPLLADAEVGEVA